MMDDQIHWFSIINSLMIVLFLSGMVAMIMMRTLHRDISKYNQLDSAEEAQEETGWKLVSLQKLSSAACCIAPPCLGRKASGQIKKAASSHKLCRARQDRNPYAC